MLEASKKLEEGAKEMAQQLRAKDLSSVLSSHMLTHNRLQTQF